MNLYGSRSNFVGWACLWVFVFVPGLPVHAQPNVDGQWGSVLNWPLPAIHAIVLKNGKVLLVTLGGVRLWDPTAEDESIVHVADPPGDPNITGNPPIVLFCSGHAQLADGRVAFFGGGQNYGDAHRHTVIFDPDAPLSNPWTLAEDMPEVVPGQTGVDAAKRWYPRVTTLGDGSVLILGGGNNNVNDDNDSDNRHALFRPSLSPQSTALTALQHFNWYAFSFLLSDGSVFVGGSHYYPVDPPATVPSFRLENVTATNATSWGNQIGGVALSCEGLTMCATAL